MKVTISRLVSLWHPCLYHLCSADDVWNVRNALSHEKEHVEQADYYLTVHGSRSFFMSTPEMERQSIHYQMQVPSWSHTSPAYQNAIAWYLSKFN
jgi:hypothetical protein